MDRFVPNFLQMVILRVDVGCLLRVSVILLWLRWKWFVDACSVRRWFFDCLLIKDFDVLNQIFWREFVMTNKFFFWFSLKSITVKIFEFLVSIATADSWFWTLLGIWFGKSAFKIHELTLILNDFFFDPLHCSKSRVDRGLKLLMRVVKAFLNYKLCIIKV